MGAFMDLSVVAFVIIMGLWLVLTVSKHLGKTAPAEARRLVKEGALLLDVRTAPEFESGHLAGARNIPLHELNTRLAEVGEKSQ